MLHVIKVVVSDVLVVGIALGAGRLLRDHIVHP